MFFKKWSDSPWGKKKRGEDRKKEFPFPGGNFFRNGGKEKKTQNFFFQTPLPFSPGGFPFPKTSLKFGG